jgi:molybdopterin synthase catalytic subunit
MSHITRQAILVDDLLTEVSSAERGGLCLFLGTVRSGEGTPGHGPAVNPPVTAIEYSAYPEMAEAELERILAEAQGKWPDARIAVRHRVGVIAAGEASIAIAAAAPHRAEAFDACRYVIEAVKQRLPMWKKELHVDGTAVWVDPHGHPVAAGPQ